MGDISLSGYKQGSETALVWTSGQSLDSLSDNEWTDLSDAIDNSTNKYVFDDLEAVLASAAFAGVDSILEVYLVPSVDGSTYGSWTGNVTTDEQENEQYWVGSLITSGATAAQRLILRDVERPNGLFKYGFRNTTGIVTAASGNDVNYRSHQKTVA